MNTINKIIIAVLTLILSVNFSFADESKYKLDAANINFTSDNSLEFDIYLFNESQEELRYSLGQYFLEFNPKIANGGTLTYSLIASDLPEALRPRNASIKDNLLRLACNQVSSDKQNLPVISNQSPGTLVARMKLETSAKNFADEPLNLIWADNSKLLKTKIFTFDGKNNVEITNSVSTKTDGVIGNKGNESITSVPTEYALAQNYPNPFNPSTTINYELPESGQVTLRIYDLLGKEVATLVNEKLEAGRYSVTFNGSSVSGGLASGMYFYKITAGNYTAVKKMVLIK
ncbi:MAG: hypothetical protein HGGPFJEG_01555 [Ignavibacteria bacterium]|nr:hypothetical protein [Ignavibacteria bacterium]